jgi:4-hydroxy-tetrahydrodipicolinate synthase
MRALFVETNPIPVKAALEIMRHVPAHYRLPLVPPSSDVKGFLRSALADAGLLEVEA